MGERKVSSAVSEPPLHRTLLSAATGSTPPQFVSPTTPSSPLQVLNKYFPPDFDPSKMPRMKKVRSEDKQMKVGAAVAVMQGLWLWWRQWARVYVCVTDHHLPAAAAH